MRQVQWLGQVDYGGAFPAPCSATNPCPTGFNCINGACVPSAVPRTATPAPFPRINPALLPAVKQPEPKKTDNTVLWVLGGTIVLGVLYYAMK